MTEGIRLNKFLASCGAGSRRACDELIQSGRVEVNGDPCLNLGTRIRPDDHVKVDGRSVRQQDTVVIAFHKPRGFVCSRDDEMNRDTIYAFLPKKYQTLHHVGRLDLDSEGLLVLTNDGDLTQKLMHPSKGVEKEYLVTANQAFESAHLDQFLEGIYTPEGGKLRAKSIERLSPRRIGVVLEHGAKRQIRVMFEAMGYQVTKLLRVRIGNLWLGDLEPGSWAILSPVEIGMLLGKPLPTTKARDGIRPRKAPAAKTAKVKPAAPPPPPPRSGRRPASRQHATDAPPPRRRAR